MGFAKTLNNACGLEYVLDNDNETGNNNIEFPDDIDPADTAMPVLKLTNINGAPTAVLPLAGEIAYDSVSGAVYVHQGAGSWARLYDSISDSPTLSEVLTEGNTSGANNISMNSGQSVSFAGDINIPSTSATSNLKFGYLAGNSITSGQRNTLCGPEASSSLTTGNFNVTVGYLSRTSAVDTTGGTSVGTSTVTANNATGVGRSSIASGENSCSLGYLSSATGLRSTSIGYNCSTTVADGTVLGANTFCSGINGLALGKSARCEAGNAVALGPNVTNTVANSVKMAPSSHVFIDSTLKVSDAIIRNLPISLDLSDANITLTTAQLLGNYVSISSLSANRDCFFPTFANLNSAIPDKQNNDSFIFYIENSDATHNVVLKPNTGCSFQPSGATSKTIGPTFIATCLIQIFSAEYHIRILSVNSS